MIGIYSITNKINNKRYIGQSIHIEIRWMQHKQPSSRSLIGKAIQKYGLDNFIFEVLEECPADSLDEKEEYYINYYNSVVPNGYNIEEKVDGKSFYYTFFTKETLLEIIKDLSEDKLLLSEIAEKYDLSNRTISRINNGYSYYNSNISYPVRKTILSEPYYCVDCGKKIWRGATRCKQCQDIYQRVVDRPNRETLKSKIRVQSFRDIGLEYGVSDNAVKKWCIRYNLPSKKKDIKLISDSDWEQI